jgi:hypothetical protein
MMMMMMSDGFVLWCWGFSSWFWVFVLRSFLGGLGCGFPWRRSNLMVDLIYFPECKEWLVFVHLLL